MAADIWSGLAESAIDQGVLEQANRIAVAPAKFGWSNVGDWNIPGGVIARDDFGNSMRGDIVPSQTRNSVVWSETGCWCPSWGWRTLPSSTPRMDTLLVASRGDAQDVRTIVEQLKVMRRRGF